MAKKNIEQLQKEYDEIIINLDRLNNAVNQSTETLEWYQDAANNATETEKRRAEKNKRNAEIELAVYDKLIQQKKRELEAGGVKKSGSGRNGERTAEDIESEKYKDNFSGANFVAGLKEKGGMSGKAGIAAGIASVVGDLFGAGTDIYIAEQKKSLNTWLANQDAYLKTLETGSKIFQRHMKTFSKGMQGALSSSFASITQGVQEGAYSAATSSIDYASESLTNMFADRFDKMVLKNFKELNQKKTELENLKLTTQQATGAIDAIGSVASLAGPVGSIIGGIVGGIAKSTAKILEANAEIDVMRLQKEIEIKEKELEAITEAKNSAVESSKEATSKVLEFAKSIENLSLKTDAAARSMGNIIGMSGGNVAMYEKFVYGAARNLKFNDSSGKTTYLNKNAEDMLKMQSQYIDASERNGTMSQKDFVKTFQLGEVIGDDNLAATLLGDMDYFNKSIATGTDLIFDMFKEANKAGVSNRKFAKDLQQNLKLAQKYTFKGGVEGMMKMSIWAQKTRFNMQNLENMVDSIQDGGLEGVLTKSAKLQVLGGNMAMGADPLAMMYEAWADPEALAKRFTDMTKGVGHFNSKTGEVDIVGPDAMRLKEYAAAAGIDYKDARAQVTQRIKGEQIDKQLTKNYTDQQKALIYNKAKLGENGEWQVTLDNGQVKNINDLQGTDWNDLMPAEESIEDYVSKIYDLLKQQGGVTNYSQAVMADETFDNLQKNIDERMKENVNWVSESSDALKSMVEKSNDFVTTQNEQQHQLMLATTKILDSQFDIIEKSTERLKLSFEKGGSDLVLSIDAVRKELDYELAKMRYGENSQQAKDAAAARDVADNNVAKAVIGEASDAKAGAKVSQESYENAKKVYDWFLDESNKKNINEVMGRLISKYESGSVDVSDYEDVLETGYDDLMDAIENTGVGRNDDIESWEEHGIGLIQALIKYASEREDFEYDKTVIDRLKSAAEGITVRDGIVSNGNNKPIVSQANNVTKINDGLVESDPKDVAIFAKEGGVIGNFLDNLYNDVHSTMGGSMQMDTVRVEISGNLELTSGGQSVNIINELQNNPILLRSLSRMLSEHISSAMNGGRGTSDFAIGSV